MLPKYLSACAMTAAAQTRIQFLFESDLYLHEDHSIVIDF